MRPEHIVNDFVIGKHYKTIVGSTCVCTEVANSYIRVAFNNKCSIKYPKQLFAGTYVALQNGMPFIYSQKVKPIIDTTIEHKLYGPRKHRNIYFMLNITGETYFDIYKNHENKI